MWILVVYVMYFVLLGFMLAYQIRFAEDRNSYKTDERQEVMQGRAQWEAIRLVSFLSLAYVLLNSLFGDFLDQYISTSLVIGIGYAVGIIVYRYHQVMTDSYFLVGEKFSVKPILVSAMVSGLLSGYHLVEGNLAVVNGRLSGGNGGVIVLLLLTELVTLGLVVYKRFIYKEGNEVDQ